MHSSIGIFFHFERMIYRGKRVILYAKLMTQILDWFESTSSLETDLTQKTLK